MTGRPSLAMLAGLRKSSSRCFRRCLWFLLCSAHSDPHLQFETYEIDPKKPKHGSDGPLKVSFGGEILDTTKSFMELGPKFEKDRPWSDEGHGFDVASINVFFVCCYLCRPKQSLISIANAKIYLQRWTPFRCCSGSFLVLYDNPIDRVRDSTTTSTTRIGRICRSSMAAE